MENTVYTLGLIKAIIEETRLNSYPQCNHSLYRSLQEARTVLSHTASEPINQVVIQDIEAKLAQHPASYAAQRRLEELTIFQAERIIRAYDVFELPLVERLILNLGSYKTAEAQDYRVRLGELQHLVEEGKKYAHVVRKSKSEESRAHQVLEVLAPYAQRSADISGVHRLLAEHLGLQNLFSGFPEVRAEEVQPTI